jgi:Dimerisation domain/Helix-turn-helix domain of resolvase
MLARVIMAGTKLGVFEALAAGPLTCDEVAERCGRDRRATAKLLNALIGAGCVHSEGGRYRLTSAARRGLLESSPNSWRDQTLLHYLEWRWWDHCEDYVRTGQPLRVHDQMTDEEWGIYQRGMRSGIEMPAHWVARHLPMPRAAARERGIHWGGSVPGRRIRATVEQIAVIRRLRSEGGEIAAIARATGLSRPTIYRILGEDCNASSGFSDGEPVGRVVRGTGPV